MKKLLSLVLLFFITGCNLSENNNKYLGLDVVKEGFVINNDNENKYIEVYLDEGTYGVSSYDNYYSAFGMEIFDKEKVALKCFPQFDFYQGGYVDFLYFTFHIKEKGTYYFKFFNGSAGARALKFEKLDYESYFWQEKEVKSKMEGTIEGKHDIDYYYYENYHKKKIATITNNSEKTIFIIIYKKEIGTFLSEIPPKKTIDLELEPGKTGFGITHSFALFMSENSDYRSTDSISFDIKQGD